MSRLVKRQDFRDAWVLIDRPESGNDNAWHLFCYLRQTQPGVNAYYVLDETSPRNESARCRFGKRIVRFRSYEWKELMARCSVLISSQLTRTIRDHPELKDVIERRSAPWVFAYLSHGVARGDNLKTISWAEIDFRTSATPSEHRQSVSSNHPFGRSEENTALTGLCRWDSLISGPITSDADAPLLILAPTWRHSLVTQIASTGMEMEIRIAEFLQSAWLTHWSRLIELIQEENARNTKRFKVKLLAHPQMRQIAEIWPSLGLPDIDFLLYDDVDFQAILKSASQVVTDYSSIAFDVAVLRKPLVYFHFEGHEDASNGHTEPGYFDYDVDGFGPVVTTANDALREILSAAEREFRQEDRFAARAAEELVLADGLACERTFRAIEAFMRQSRVAEQPSVGRKPGSRRLLGRRYRWNDSAQPIPLRNPT